MDFCKNLYKLFNLCFFLFAFLLTAGVLEKEVTFRIEDLSFSKLDVYDLVKLEGCESTVEVGAPLLPRAAFSLLIPQGAEVADIEVVSADKEEITGEYDVYPTQHPQPFLKGKVYTFAPPDENIYNQNLPYPEQIIESPHSGSMGGYRLASVLIYPLQYIPQEKKLIFYSRIRFKVTYEEKLRSLNIRKTEKQNKIFKERVGKLILNPEDIGMLEPSIGLRGSLDLTPDTVEYVIITTDSFAASFQELADWKTKKGIPAKVVTLDSIYANYAGADHAEMVRNFIIDANSSWGTIWVLLGGQCDYEWGQEIVPRRNVWYRYVDGDETDTIPADLYFSDLDGDWNADGDGIYGESTDDVDLYSDVFVGRAPVRTVAQAETFVNKVLTYEKSPPYGYQKKILLPAAVLWTSYDEKLSQEAIADMIPGDWQVSKMYERDGNLTHAAFVDSVRSGFGFAHLVGHGNQYGIYTYYADAYFNSNDLDALDNDSLLGIHNSIGCMCGAIDYVPYGDCFAEHYLTPSTGGSYSIMNSRYGWGSPPNMGPSEHIDTCFYHEIFRENYTYHDHVGTAHAFSKDGYVSRVTWGAVWAWCIYELNLFGDPEMPLWTDDPGELTVTHDAVIPVGGSSFSVNVTDGGFGIEGALVCLFKEGEVYSRGYTDASGNINLTLSPPPNSLGIMYCTVTKNNYIPYEGTVDVISPSGPWVIFEQYTVIDGSGNSDGNVDPGESIELPFSVHNVGLDDALSVTGIIHTEDPYVTLTDSIEDFGNILSDSIAESLEDFDFDVLPGCPENHVINFELLASDVNDSTWISYFSVPISTPDISLLTDTLNFDTVYIGHPDTLELLVNNVGTDTLRVSSITSDNIDFSVDMSNFDISPGESQAVSVIFSPAAEVSSTGNLTLECNDLDEPSLTVFLQGEGLLPPDISVSPDSLSDSLFTGETSTDTLTIYNTGGSDLNFDISIEALEPAANISFRVTDFKNDERRTSVENSVTGNYLTPEFSKRIYESDVTPLAFENILVMEEGPGTYYYDTALDNLGLSRTLVTSWSALQAELNSEIPWQLVIVNSYSYVPPNEVLDSLNAYQENGGFLIYSDWALFAYSSHPLLTSLGIDFVSDFTTPLNFYAVNPGHLIFNNPNDIDSLFWTDNQYYRDGEIVDILAGATQLAYFEGYPDYGTIVLNAEENCLFNAFQAMNFNADDDSDGKLDIVELIENEIMFLSISWLSAEPTSGTIPVDDSVIVEVTFDATGLYGGDYHADITINSNDPDEPELVVPAHLHVTGAPDITVSEDTLDYGTVFSGYSSTDTLIVSNVGTDLLNVSDVSSDNSDFTVDITSFTLDPDETQDIVVTFTPSELGTITGTLTITSDDPNNPSLTVFLRGECVEPPDISVSPDSLSDTLFTGETSTHSLTIYNTGESDLNFVISIEGEGSTYALEFDGVNDYVEVPDHPSLSAIGGAFTLECWMNVGEDPIRPREILGKWGSGGSSDDEYGIDIPAPGIIELAISGSTGGMTEIRSDTISPYTWTHVAGVFDSASTSLELFINGNLERSMTPSTITMNRNTGQPFRMGTYDLSFHPNFKGQLDEIRIWNVARTQPEIQSNMYRELLGTESGLIGYWKFNEGSGDTAYDASPNNNDGTLHNGATWVVSSSPVVNWIYVDTTSGSIPAGDSLIVEVTFDATNLYGGDYYADIIVASNDPDEPEVSVPAYLHVIGAPDITVSEDTLDYGTVFSGYSSTDTLIVLNVGTDSLTVSDISSDNSDYTVDITNFILDPGEEQEVVVTFTPSSLGIITGNLTITSDDPDEPSLNVFLQGESLEPPDISVSPDSLSDSLFTGETSTDTLTIYNTGGSDLFFDISIGEMVLEALGKTTAGMTSFSSRQFEYLEVGKGEIDPRKGDPVVLGAGGPDSFGYTWIDSDEGGSFQFDWVDISSTGTQITGLSDDYYVGPYPISFEFPFYDSVFTAFYVSSNGFIGFGPTSGYSSLSNQPIPTTSSPNNIISWCWDDLYPNGSVYYQDFGDRLIVQFVDYGEYGGSGRINAEVIIYRSGQIIIQYLNTYNGFDISGNTIGIENITGGDGLQVAFNTDYIHDSLAVKFSIGPTWLSVEPVSDTIPSGDSLKVEVTFDANGLYGGDYYADITINSNDPDESELVVPAHLHVTGAPDIAVSADTLNYGTIFTGYSSTDTLIVSNVGTDSLTVSDISSDNSDYTVDITNFILYPGETREVEVIFTPSSTGTITGNLTIVSDDPDNPNLTVFLLGECVEPPDISVSPNSFSDTLFTGETSTDTLMIYNTGGSDLNFNISIEEAAGILMNKVQVKTKRFLGTLAGRKLTPQLSTGFSDNPYISGRPVSIGVPSVKKLNAQEYKEFTDKPYNSGHPASREEINPGEIRLGNKMAIDIRLLILKSSGDVSEMQSLLLSFPDISVVEVFDAYSATPSLATLLEYDCVITANNYPFDDPTALGNVLADYLDAGGGVILTVPSFASGYSIQGRLLNEGYTPFNIGSGPIGPLNLGNFNASHPIMAGVTAALGNALVETSIATGAELIAEWDSDTTEGLPFIATKGSNVAGVNIYFGNPGYWTGDIPLILHNTAFWTLSYVSWLYCNPTSGTIQAGDSAFVEITFDATDLSSGDYHANIIVSSNDPDEPEVAVPTHLHVTGAPDIAVSEDTLDYGIVFPGYSSSDTLIISNEGTDPLTVYDISSDNSDYTVDTNNFILNAGENRGVAITFTPSSTGIIPGNLTITSNDPVNPTLAICLMGECIEPPIISVAPDSLSDTLNQEETSTHTLTIYNSGVMELIFDISTGGTVLPSLSTNKTPARNISLSSQFEYLEVKKGEVDSRKGDPVVLRAGGPDLFGYTWSDSDEGGSCEFEWADISSTGTQVTGLSDDNFAGPYQISFEFPFYDTVYTEFYISSNGLIGFGPTSDYSSYSNQPIPTSNTPNNIIAWCWDDLYPDGSVYYENSGDKLIIQFVDYGEYGASGRINAEVILHRSGRITIQYLNTYNSFDIAGNTIGIENITGGDGLQVAFNTDYIHDSLAVEFTIGPKWLSVTPVSDTISSGDSVSVEVTFDATGMSVGDHYADIIISSNDPENPETSVPSHLHVSSAGIEEGIPKVFFVKQNYPNPFSTNTVIQFGCPEPSNVRLLIYDVMGRVVTVLIDNEVEAGYHSVNWNGTTNSGRKVASAVYFYRLETDKGFNQTKKMIHLQ